jgi:MFS transporter, MHS family, proline/betaine transporter
MRAWGWRLPFIVGLAIGMIGLYIRRDLERGAKFIEPQGIGAIEEPRRSFVDAMKTERLAIFKVIGLKATSAVGFYTLFVYMTVYFTKIVQIPKSDALAINTIALAAMLVMIPGAGALSDRVGRKPLLVAGAVGMLLFSLPLFRLLRDPEFWRHPHRPVVLHYYPVPFLRGGAGCHCRGLSRAGAMQRRSDQP